MAVAILSLSTANNWSIPLSRKHRLRAHWILQLLGSALGIIGSALEINNKTVHFNSVHGQLGKISCDFLVLMFLFMTKWQKRSGDIKLFDRQTSIHKYRVNCISHINFKMT